MADDGSVRVEVGFDAGQVLGAFVSNESAEELQRALHEDGPRVVVLHSEEGDFHIVVPRVAYLKRFARSSRVGFGSG